MSVLLEFSMFPTDKGESVSEYVSRILRFIDESKVSYKLTAMGTIIETGSMDEALEIVSRAFELLEPDCNRIYATFKIDYRKGKSGRMTQKLRSVGEKTGKNFM